jgi:cytochrome c oxidase subunit 2
VAATTFDGQCAELCGYNHADMRAQVKAVTPDQYETWADKRADEIEAAGRELGKQRKEGEGEVIPK